MTLIRSKDRKVANAVSPNGKTATIANTFGLPAEKTIPALIKLLLVPKYATLANLKKYIRVLGQYYFQTGISSKTLINKRWNLYCQR